MRLPLRLELGPYEEGLRRCLLGEKFSEGAVLNIIVTSRTPHGQHEPIYPPCLVGQTPAFRKYAFGASGIEFQLVTGKAIPESMQAHCAVRSSGHLIFTTTQAFSHKVIKQALAVGEAEISKAAHCRIDAAASRLCHTLTR